MAISDLPPLDPEKGEWDEKALSRRNFLEAAVVFGTLAGAGAVAVSVPSMRFLVGKSLEPPVAQWVELGKVSDLSANDVTRVNYSVRGTDAWREVTKRGTVYVYSDDGGESFVALDGTCTHLGCIVQWHDDEQKYKCPCHAGFFTREGEVISGPPPRPLRELPVKTENGLVFAEI
ncbi:MAG: hypothetical protein BroJett015_08210 [Chloroflexota bacterium]|nr:MAG: hypothetical protein BroJett015_08210 [Chloroflexota bacterium]